MKLANSLLPEVAGDNALYADPEYPVQIREAREMPALETRAAMMEIAWNLDGGGYDSRN